MSLSLAINMLLEVLALSRRQEKEIKVLNIGKLEAKLILFADDLIVCIGNPKEHKNRLWERISEFRKGQCTKKIKYISIYSQK